MVRRVQIGKRFLTEVRSQYESWQDAFVREAFQNCVDAPKSRIVKFDISYDRASDQTVVRFSNDGKPMDEVTLTDKLLTLGESGKEHEGTVGGFGRAKELLYFANARYKIVSGQHVVEGEGCEYELFANGAGDFHGTSSVVWLDGNHAERLNGAVIECVAYSEFKGQVFLNGEEVIQRTEKGKKRDWDSGDGWGKVYTSKQHKNLLLVRVGGVLMFKKRVDYGGCVVLELLTSRETLTSNRDGLQYQYRWKLDEFTESLAVNRKSAFKPKAPKYQRYLGTRLAAPLAKSAFKVAPAVERQQAPAAWSAPAVETHLPDDEILAELVRDGEIKLRDGGAGPSFPVGPKTLKAVVESGQLASEPVTNSQNATLAYGGNVAVKHDFVIRNELCETMKVPVYYDPAEEKFSTYSKWLVSVWGKLMVELHALFEKRSCFSVGFLFEESQDDEDGSTLAAYESVSNIGDVYYIAPCSIQVVPGLNDTIRKLVPRWDRSDRWELLSAAAHEFVHGEGYDYHNEKFASRFTAVMGKVLKNKDRFNHCFKA